MVQQHILVSGSLAYDRIMNFSGGLSIGAVDGVLAQCYTFNI